MLITCAYCNRPAMPGDVLNPAMCRKHLDLRLLAGCLVRAGVVVNAANLAAALDLLDMPKSRRMDFTAVEIQGLLDEMVQSGSEIPPYWRNGRQQLARTGRLEMRLAAENRIC